MFLPVFLKNLKIKHIPKTHLSLHHTIHLPNYSPNPLLGQLQSDYLTAKLKTHWQFLILLFSSLPTFNSEKTLYLVIHFIKSTEVQIAVYITPKQFLAVQHCKTSTELPRVPVRNVAKILY